MAFVLSAVSAAGAVPAAEHPAAIPEVPLAWKNLTVPGRRLTVFRVFRDSGGLVWFGTNSGLYFYDGVNTLPVNTDNERGFQIYDIVEYDGSLYLGSNNGLLRHTPWSGEVTTFPECPAREIRCLMKTDDTLWIGSLGGLYAMNLKDGTVTDKSATLPNRSVYSMLRDSRGVVYVGTYSGLARQQTSGDFRSVAVTAGGREHGDIFVNCMEESPDGRFIYIGTESGLYRYEPQTDRWTVEEALDGNVVKCLAFSNDRYLLAGTEAGLFVLTGRGLYQYKHDSRFDQTLSADAVWDIMSDGDMIWAGNDNGVSLASNSAASRILKLSVLTGCGDGKNVSAMLRDCKGRLWIGGSNGLIMLADGRNPRWFRHGSAPGALSHDMVRGITEDSEGRLWLSTDGGINRYNEADGSFDVIHVTDSAGTHRSNWVYSIAEDGDHLWVGSYLGGVHYVAKSALTGAGDVVAEAWANESTSTFRGHSLRLENGFINNILRDGNGSTWILLFRGATLTEITAGGDVRSYDIPGMTGEYATHMARDNRGRVWCGFKGGVVIFTAPGKYTTVRYSVDNSDEYILSMGAVGDKMWISTRTNLWEATDSGMTLLPVLQNFYTSIYEDTQSGRIFLGGEDEILEVDPAALVREDAAQSIRMVLCDDGTSLTRLSADGDGITLPHKGSVSLMMSTLDYTPGGNPRYTYKLARNAADTVGGWITLPDGTNTISLTNLSMGDYILMVRSAGTPMAPFAMKVRVGRPWFLSWWAMILYAMAAAAVCVGIILYMRRRNMLVLKEEERRKALDNVEKKLSFLSNISHDLKTPLSMIIGPVGLLKEKIKDKDHHRTLESVYDNAVKLNGMIHRTLELERLDGDAENMLILSTFDAVGFCRNLFEAFEENHPHKKFVFHTSCQRLMIEVDAVKFESIITNLLSNACKYSEEDSTVSLGIARREGTVEITVSDDGLGIPEKDQPLVFDRMFRAQSTAAVREGTGLGLYLIKKYLEMMGGNVELFSRPDQGTSFTVILPVSAKESASVAEDDTSATDTARPGILIVEDNSEIASFIRDILRKEYSCLIAENGRAGLSLAASFAPDLIIIDEMMPVMSGLEMVRRLKQNPRLAHIPIIMLTAKDDNATENESIRLGVDAFMSKPFDSSTLLARINNLVGTKNRLREQVRIDTITAPRPIEAESVTEKQLARIAKIIEDNISDPELNVNMLCDKSGISNRQLYRIVKKYVGLAPLDYIRSVRLRKAAMLLSQHRFSVSEVSYMVGFNTPSYFAKCFQGQFGVAPSQYRSDDEKIETNR